MNRNRFSSLLLILLFSLAAAGSGCSDTEKDDSQGDGSAEAAISDRNDDKTGDGSDGASVDADGNVSSHDLLEEKLEDLTIPRSDLGTELPESGVLDNRIIVNLNRDCEFIVDGRNFGYVGTAEDEIREYLTAETRKREKNKDGTTELTLLIRADVNAPFSCVQMMMQISGELGIMIYKIELAISVDEGEKEGKLSVQLPRDSEEEATGDAEGVEKPEIVELEDLPKKIDVNIIRDKAAAAGYYIEMRQENYRGADMIPDFFRAVSDLRRKVPDIKATIWPHKGVQYGHIVKVVDELLRAGLTQITFGGTPLDK